MMEILKDGAKQRGDSIDPLSARSTQGSTTDTDLTPKNGLNLTPMKKIDDGRTKRS